MVLKSDKYLDDRYLSRTMRQYFKRGHNHTHNQIMVRSDDYTVFVLNGNVWLKIPSLIKGKRIARITSLKGMVSVSIEIIYLKMYINCLLKINLRLQCA
jgi:hypothetical protein